MKLKILAATAAAAWFAGCSDNSGAAPTQTDAPEMERSAEPADPAPSESHNQAEEIMGPSAGMWEMQITTGDTTIPATSVCYEETLSLAEMERQQQQAGVTCSKQDYRREGAVIVGQSVCEMNGMEIVVDQRITGDMSSQYTAEMISTMDPPPAPDMGSQEITVVARRTGDC